MYRDDRHAQREVEAQLVARVEAVQQQLAQRETALAAQGLYCRGRVARRLRFAVLLGVAALGATPIVMHRLVGGAIVTPSQRSRARAELALSRARERTERLQAVFDEDRRIQRWLGAARQRARKHMMSHDANRPGWAWHVLGLWACSRDDDPLLARAMSKLGTARARRGLRDDCAGLAGLPRGPR